jgi:hypothetical protein
MGRPIDKRYFGRLEATSPKDPTNPTTDGKDQTGRALTSTSLYTLKARGYNIPVYKARVVGGDLDIGGDAANTPYIIAQKGSRKYRVNTSSGQGNCVLVNDDGSSGIAAGEMVLAGFLGGDAGGSSPIFIQKLTKHYAADFSGNRYKWYITNSGAGEDSSLANVLALVDASATTVGADKI